MSRDGFTARSYHSAVVLDGKVYVIGGHDAESELLASVEVYDPSSDTWSAVTTSGTYTKREAGHCAAVVNNKIYVMGGGSAINVVEAFDPATSSWSTPTTTGTFTTGLGATADVIDGKIYVVGGTNYPPLAYLNRLEVFDPATNTWTTPATTGTFTKRVAHSSAYVDGKLYIIGGYSNATGALATVDVLDVATNTWSNRAFTGAFPPRYGHTSSVVDGKIYVIGGYSTEPKTLMFDPVTSVWTTLETTGIRIENTHASSVVVNGKIYAMAGENADEIVVNSNDVFTPGIANSVDMDVSASSLVVSPNPTHGIVQLSNLNEQLELVTITNTLGVTMRSFENNLTAITSLDLSGLVPGVYYATFISHSSMSMKAVVLQP